MDYYKEDIAKKDQVEVIWVPLDRTEDAMESWAKSEEFPWPTIKMKSARDIKAINEHMPRGVPGYILVDAEGEKLATGRGEIKSKLAELIDG